MSGPTVVLFRFNNDQNEGSYIGTSNVLMKNASPAGIPTQGHGA